MPLYAPRPAIVPRYDNPLDRMSEAKSELDYDVALKTAAHIKLADDRAKKVKEDADRAAAQRMHQEFKDEDLAQSLAKEEKRNLAEAHTQSYNKSPMRLREDARLAQQLADEEAAEIEDDKRRMLALMTADEQLAKTLQSGEVAKDHDSEWVAPNVNYEQRDSCLMFWIKLPGLNHADVCVNHDTKGNATINIEAIPASNPTIMRKFLVDLKLSTDTSREIKTSDVLVSYDDTTSLLEIKCLGLQLSVAKREKMVARLKRMLSFQFGAKNSYPQSPNTPRTDDADALLGNKKATRDASGKLRYNAIPLPVPSAESQKKKPTALPKALPAECFDDDTSDDEDDADAI